MTDLFQSRMRTLLPLIIFSGLGVLVAGRTHGQSHGTHRKAGGVHFHLSDKPDVTYDPLGSSYDLDELEIEPLKCLVAEASPPSPRHGRYCQPDDVRSGCPELISPFATRSLNCEQYSVGRIGGGSFLGGEGPCVPHDGTWAIDYTGKFFFPRSVFLGWSHGLKYQGGYGAYGTEAPFNPHTRHSHEHE